MRWDRIESTSPCRVVAGRRRRPAAGGITSVGAAGEVAGLRERHRKGAGVCRDKTRAYMGRGSDVLLLELAQPLCSAAPGGLANRQGDRVGGWADQIVRIRPGPSTRYALLGFFFSLPLFFT